ncbi:MAG: septal ring lytic transglycosylase RlpA family protein [candidate division KSB1 bacterium]|nr:septal ring lytic transglycosylase RlpA family protein [candidate division KSB1 bacterium]MDZ7336050.1 septal ring lytic transglycosylase RlpA family protein [candidate division KSB1 bacterium]MDZ7358062.1 septal ring lytic transglycosylase RlpA family protein [candidate division KSB1 bacterium]MDZ7402235.1 septal ring lytic transglycosylase RlpA family protein [candidate division KSB1 bacterium]
MTSVKIGSLIVLISFVSFIALSDNCSRRKYLDNPSIEIPFEEPRESQQDTGIVYLEKKQVKEQPQQATLPSQQAAKPAFETIKTNPKVVKVEYGRASYYADKFQGRPTASGELYDRQQLTAAHRTLPFNTMCRVTNISNKKSVIVRINDRGPHVSRRIIDLSYEAMRQLDGLSFGEIDVMLEVLQ